MGADVNTGRRSENIQPQKEVERELDRHTSVQTKTRI